MNELALFAGAGGGILGGHLLGWRTVCAVEYDPYAASVLCARQNDGALPPFPIWDDVRTFRGAEWRGRVDVVSGGFPCQDISAAGKGAGITGSRSGLWSEMARIVGEVRPRFVFVENSPNLVGRGLAVVLGDLAALGYDARWGVLGAHHVGAPHKRDRIWIVAHANGGGKTAVANAEQPRRAEPCGAGNVAHAMRNGRHERRTERERQQGRAASDGAGDVANANGGGCREKWVGRGHEEVSGGRADEWMPTAEPGEDVPDGDIEELQGWVQKGCADPEGREGQVNGSTSERDSWGSGDGRGGRWWQSEPNVGGMANVLASDVDLHGAAAFGGVGRVASGVPARVNRLKCIGNGQVPLCAAMAWRILAASDGGDKEAGE